VPRIAFFDFPNTAGSRSMQNSSTITDGEDFSWIYFLSIGVQASIVTYMVSSFFAPVAYNWYAYYLIAYAICLRRIYQTEQNEKGIPAEENGLSDYFKLQKA
jgi:hypothetical protein